MNCNVGAELGIDHIGKNIVKDNLVVSQICDDNGIVSITVNPTDLFSKDNKSNDKLAGFDIYSLVENTVLEYNYNY